MVVFVHLIPTNGFKISFSLFANDGESFAVPFIIFAPDLGDAEARFSEVTEELTHSDYLYHLIHNSGLHRRELCEGKGRRSLNLVQI